VKPSVWQFMVDSSLKPTQDPNPTQKAKAERYFRATPLNKDKNRAIALLDVGAAALVISAVMGVLGGSATFLIVAVGGLVGMFVGWSQLEDYGRRFLHTEPKATDAEMDSWLNQQLKATEQEAMSRLAITPLDLDGTASGAVGFDPWGASPHQVAPNHAGPFTVFGPVLDPKVHRVGDDGIWRFRSYEVMALCPTTRYLGVYECVLDTVTGKRSKVELREYDYSDIVMVSLVDEPTKLEFTWLTPQGVPQFAGGKAKLRKLEIVVASGDRSEIVAGVDFPLIPGGKMRLQNSGLEDIVQRMRRLVRTKRRTS
jgi:hypothetical protein